jgi:hypothetical protein
MMGNKRAIVVFLCVLSLPVPAAADGTGDMFSFMFRMMLTMMNIMANSSNNTNTWYSPLNYSSGLGVGSWPLTTGGYGLGGWPGMGVWPGGGFGATPWTLPMAGNPWASPPGVNPFAAARYGLPVTRPWPGIPGGWNAYRGESLLEGTWYGTSGEILEVRGHRFVLRDPATSLGGVLDIDNNLVKMYSPQTGVVNVYQFVRNETELALQEPGGQRLLFYRRPFMAGLPIRIF